MQHPKINPRSDPECGAQAVKNTSLDNDDNDDHKQTLMDMFNLLFLELILCIVLVS